MRGAHRAADLAGGAGLWRAPGPLHRDQRGQHGDRLGQRRGRVVTRDILLDHVWGEDVVVIDRTVDVHIRHLRQKLNDDPNFPEYIETVRGVGYRFVEENRPAARG